MPDGDGLALLDHLRKINPLIPILIFVTGFSSVSTEECLQRGAQAVLTKPFKRTQLVSAIHGLLAKIPA